MLGGIEVTAKAREHARDMQAAAMHAPAKAAPAAGASAARAPAAADSSDDSVRRPRPPAARRR
jgi:hypothetical protein